MQSVDVSIVIPTFNERDNMEELIRGVHNTLNTSGKSYEIIVVDDNSPDGTAEVTEELAEKITCIKLVNRRSKMGIGSAILEGVKNSVGKIIVTMDADLSHPPGSIAQLLTNIETYDVIVGSRYIQGGRMVSPFIRRFLSKVLNGIIRTILNLDIRDCTGGFMAIKREVFDSTGEIKGEYGNYAFELLYKAKKLGFGIKEVPFTYMWRGRGNSKTQFFKYGWAYLLSALNLPFNKE